MSDTDTGYAYSLISDGPDHTKIVMRIDSINGNLSENSVNKKKIDLHRFSTLSLNEIRCGLP